MDLDKAIQSRKSVRKYSSKKPDWRDIIEAIDSARYAPMAGNIFSLRIIFVDDKEIIKKLADAAQQSFISQAKYIVVFCTDSKKTENAYEKRAERYCRQQAGAAMQNFMLKLEKAGLSTCWIGHFVDHQVKEALKITPEIDVEAFFPIGYNGELKSAKRRIEADLDNVLFFNIYKNKKLVPAEIIKLGA